MADDIKKDADAQRAKQAPQPRVKESGDASLSDVVDTLKQGNQEQSKTTEANLGLANNMVNIANSIESFGLRANAALDNLGSSMMGNKLKELETKKENAARDERTNELLEELVDNTDTDLLESPKGFFGTVLASVAAVTGALAGLIGGFALGLFESTKLLGSAFRGFFARIATSLDDLFGNRFSKGLKTIQGLFRSRLIVPVENFFKGIRASFNLGNKGLKLYKPGLVNSLANFFGGIFRTIRLSVKGMGNNLKGLKATLGTFFGSIGTAVKGFGQNFSKMFNLGDDFKKAGDSINSIKTFLARAVAPFTRTAKAAETIGKVGMLILRPIKMVGEFFKFFAAKFAPVGKVLGKLFLPVTIVMGIFDGIKGAITGASEQEGIADKFIGGIFGAIKGILVGLVGMPIDLLLDLVGWIAGKLGFENAGEALGNISISNLIGNIIDIVRDFTAGVVDFVVGLFTFDGEKIKAGFGKITDVIGNFLKPILRSVLPDPSADLFSIQGIASKAIPDFIYEYAGINPETGEMAPFENALTKGVMDSGEELNQASIENEDNKKQVKGVNQSAVLNQSVKQSTAQTINIMGGQPLATQNELRFQG